LTDAGWAKVRASAPGHVATVRDAVIDALTPEQVRQLTDITDADRTLADVYERYDDRTRRRCRDALRTPGRTGRGANGDAR
jgi:hypothetical protein